MSFQIGERVQYNHPDRSWSRFNGVGGTVKEVYKWSAVIDWDDNTFTQKLRLKLDERFSFDVLKRSTTYKFHINQSGDEEDDL